MPPPPRHFWMMPLPPALPLFFSEILLFFFFTMIFLFLSAPLPLPSRSPFSLFHHPIIIMRFCRLFHHYFSSDIFAFSSMRLFFAFSLFHDIAASADYAFSAFDAYFLLHCRAALAAAAADAAAVFRALLFDIDAALMPLLFHMLFHARHDRRWRMASSAVSFRATISPHYY